MVVHVFPLPPLVVTPHGDAGENVKFIWEIKNPQSLAVKGFYDGVPGRIRTCDAGIRRPALRGLRCLPDALQSLYINGFEVT